MKMIADSLDWKWLEMQLNAFRMKIAEIGFVNTVKSPVPNTLPRI